MGKVQNDAFNFHCHRFNIPLSGIGCRIARPVSLREMKAADIDTPALVVDLDIFERNMARVADYAKSHGLRLRPHTKTHKSVWIGVRQLQLGAAGLTVAKVTEGEVMIAARPAEMLVAYPIIGRGKLKRLRELARATRITVALDSAEAARELSDGVDAEVGVLAEVDVGLGRVGVAPGEQLLELIGTIEKLPRLVFDGIAFYPGHIKSLDEAGRQELGKLSDLVQSILSDLRANGIEAKIVSGGSTPALFQSHEIVGLNEIRPGTYVFNDRNTVRSGACALEDCAAWIQATVVSAAKPDHMIIDGGSKTFSSDRPSNSNEVTFGYVVEAPEARFHKMNEEHGFVDLSHAAERFQVGDRVRVIPNHICVAVNLHERIYGVRGDEVERVWTVDGRGKLQ
jgi:D-serine deaminase-like pyridoxal phosphate-dependent protein